MPGRKEAPAMRSPRPSAHTAFHSPFDQGRLHERQVEATPHRSRVRDEPIVGKENCRFQHNAPALAAIRFGRLAADHNYPPPDE